MATTPSGWNSAWGDYVPGKNDFATVKKAAEARGDYSTAATAQSARNNYIAAESPRGNSATGYATPTYDVYNTGAKNNGSTAASTPASTASTAPAGWNSAWGTYTPGQNDFYTVKQAAEARGDFATAAAAQSARNNYIVAESPKGTGPTGYATLTYDTYNVLPQQPEQDEELMKLIASLQDQINGFYPALDQLRQGKSGVYESPWTQNRYSYNSTEELEQYMAYDKALYDQQIAKQKADEVAAQEQEALKLATEQKIADLNAAYDNSVDSYQQKAEELRRLKMQNEDNLNLRLSNAGDMGGIGQKQYSDTQGAYDQEYLALVLEMQNFKNQTDQAIADAQYQGDIALANAIADAQREKLAAYAAAVNNHYSDYITNSDRFYNRNLNEYQLGYDAAQDALNTAIALEDLNYQRQREKENAAYERAAQRLQLGVFSAEDAQALGIPAQDAEYWANYYRTMAQVDLAGAQQQLANLANANANGAGGRSSGGGGGTSRTNTSSYDNQDAYIDALVAANPLLVTDAGTAGLLNSNVPASLDYSPDEGVFTWMGRRFSKVSDLINAINTATISGSISDADVARLIKTLRAYGFDLDAEESTIPAKPGW